jgi:hypothetical protein
MARTMRDRDALDRLAEYLSTVRATLPATLYETVRATGRVVLSPADRDKAERIAGKLTGRPSTWAERDGRA